jgi:predicted nuclease of predicted toxin-antitoxin system
MDCLTCIPVLEREVQRLAGVSTPTRRLGEAKDREVVEYADRNDLLLVTQNQKPAELLGVRCPFISNATIAKIVDGEIREKFRGR